jgi:tetratricopeptide (TPR) repeat protein
LKHFLRPAFLPGRMRSRLILAALTLAAVARAATPLEEAVGLYKGKKYPDARAAFEKIATEDPNNAAACYYLGMTLLRRGDGKAMEDALPWLEKASKLDPTSATYLADYGGISMSVAGKTRSLSAATKGRDAMEKSLTLDPENIEARVGLWRFYTEAPWPLGSGSKGAAQLEEIRRRDPKRATMLLIDSKTGAKKFDEAFQLCDDLLAKNPDDFFALFQYARVAHASGQNLERGIACLKKYIALGMATPGTANVVLAWIRLGNIDEKLGQKEEARAAYQTALQLQPNDKAAAAALANLK